MTVFIDSNILVYAFSTDPRRGRAIEIVANGGLINAQVLNELTNVLRKKQRISWPVIEDVIHSVRQRFPDIPPLTVDTHASAVVLARDHGVSFYDALIVAAALQAGCDTLYSEDLQHCRAFGALAVVNPFGPTP